MALQTIQADPVEFRKKAVLSELKRRKQEEGIETYAPDSQQIPFHSSTATRILVHGGNRCLAGWQCVYDPVEKAYRQINQIQGPWHVLAWNGNRLVVADAEEPFQKYRGLLCEYHLSNGEIFAAAPTHQVLAANGFWFSLHRVACSQIPLASNWGLCPTVQKQDVPHSSQILPNFQYDCPICSCSYDGQPLSESGDDQDILTSLIGVQVHIQNAVTSKTWGRTRGRIRFCPRCGHPANLDVLLQAEDQRTEFLSDSVSPVFQPGEQASSAARQQFAVEVSRLRSTAGGGPNLHRMERKVGPEQNLFESILYDGIRPLVVTKVVPVEVGVKWDFTVPKYHNYYLGGVLHHNSGKTLSAVVDAIWCVLGKHPYKTVPEPPVYWRVCGSGMEEQVEKVLVEYFRKLVPRRLLKDGDWNYSQRTHMLHFANGSWVEFMSFDQDPEKGAGRSLDGVLLDDIGCSRRFMEQCRARVVDRNGTIIRTLCPEDGIGWEYEWYEKASSGDKSYARFRMRPTDNPHLSQIGLTQLIEDIGDDETQRRIRIEGDFIEIGGLIYPSLKREFHVKQGGEVGWDQEQGTWPTGIAIDPGVSKEHAVLWFAVGPGSHIHFYREFFYAGTIKELCDRIRVLSGNDNLQYFYIDGHWDWDNRTAVGSTGTQPLNIEREFQQCGLPVLKAPLDIRNWQGIDQVRNRLKVHPVTKLPQLSFDPECERTWYEMTHYAQIPPKKSDPTRHNPRIRKVDDDACDCVRIAVTSNPQFMSYSISAFQQFKTGTDEYGFRW